MRMIVHDLQEQEFAGWAEGGQGELTVISDNGTIRQCMGCFGCWTRTPGACVIRDGYNNLGELFSKSDELIIISKCMYGSYSPFVLNVLNRSISYVLPILSPRMEKPITATGMITCSNYRCISMGTTSPRLKKTQPDRWSPRTA